MPRIVRETLVSLRDLLATWGPLFLITLAALVLAYWWLKPEPPRHAVLGVGATGAYKEFGERYAQELARHGIRLELRPSAGSCENLRLLKDPKERVDFGFVLGGSCDNERTVDEDKGQLALYSLGSLFYEPVWIFYRAEKAKALGKEGVLSNLSQLKGWKVNVGVRGYGSAGLMSKLLAANLLERDEVQRSFLEDQDAVVALLGGQLDAMVLVTAPESQFAQLLIQTPGVKLFEFKSGEAYARRYPFMTPLALPRGVADLSRDVPPRDLELVAATTSLVAREGTHPALVQLMVQAAAHIHSGANWIARAGEFPTPAHSEFPLAAEAERFYKNGPPLLQRYLPFWLANLVDRMWVALFSIVAVLIPLSRIVPPLYQLRVRSRIFRWYRQLRQIEDDAGQKGADRAELMASLSRLDAKASRIAVPLAYTDELYALRQHIDLVRERLGKAR
ncbi:MAG: C4-dicarboxylate ABC transporter substrate-binding protein [Betaproteobacteria bacterium]|nr:C4-dicarboxylate ABC transporter substrate-binding protein [Betaproteobacteria bacterium]